MLRQGPNIALQVLDKTLGALDLVRQRYAAAERGEPLPNAYEGPDH